MEVYPFFVMEILKSKTNYWKVNIIVAGFSSNIYSRREKKWHSHGTADQADHYSASSLPLRDSLGKVEIWELWCENCISRHFKWKRKGFSNKKYKEAQSSDFVNKKMLRSKYEGFYHLLVKLKIDCAYRKKAKQGPVARSYHNWGKISCFLSVMLASKFTRMFKKVWIVSALLLCLSLTLHLLPQQGAVQQSC